MLCYMVSSYFVLRSVLSAPYQPTLILYPALGLTKDMASADHTHPHTHPYTHITHTPTYTHAHARTRPHTHAHAHTHAHTGRPAHAHTPTRAHICLQAFSSLYSFTHNRQ